MKSSLDEGPTASNGTRQKTPTSSPCGWQIWISMYIQASQRLFASALNTVCLDIPSCRRPITMP